MGKNETKTQPVPVTTRKRKRLGFDARAGTPPSGFWHVGEARSAQGNGSKGLAMSRRSKLRAWVVALVAALAVVVGSIGVAFAALGDVPPHTKNLRNNQDGTYTLSLDVVGDSEKKPNNVNVIVIFDTSGSMTQQRMTAAKNAVNSLANSLYAYNTLSEPDTVEMALVRFATSSRVAQQPTADANTFRSTVNGLGNAGDGGTNWESALQTANGVNFNDNDQTFVVFVSDGNPTFRTSQNGWNDWSNQYQQWGSGRETATNIQRCYTTAVDDAKALATKVTPANFFTIGAFGNVDRMEQLTDDAGSNSDTNYYSASDTAALNQAISEILAKIEMSGIGNTSIEDGTTNSVTTSSGEIANLLEVDTSSFKYSRSGGSYGTGQDWADAPEAKLVNGAVEWDLSKEGTNGILENGVKYTVTFDVYPSQTTYDTIAKLKNGDITYDSLDSEIKKYIVDNGGGSYSLRTNTNATLSYDDTRDEKGQQESPYVNPDPVATDAEKLTVKKEWVGESAPSGDLKMTVNMDGKAFSTVTLNKGNSWSDDSYISIGIIKNGEALPGAEGHDFSFAELDDSQYRWELDAPTVHPMLVGGKLTMLVKEDADHKAPAGATKYTIGQGTYYADNAVTNLTATNTRRSNLNLKKVVTGDNAPADALFPFTLKVKNSKADPSDSTNGDNVVWFSIQDKGGNIVKDANRVSGATAEDGDTGYYYADSNAAISVKLKAGENLRFTNLPSGSTYEFTEGDASGFEFVTAENTGENDSTFTGGKTSTGTVEKAGNLSYEVTYTNKYTPEPVKASFPVKKVIEKADGLTGPSEWSYTIDVTANGNAPEAETMTGTVNQSNDTVTFGDFTFTAPGTYTYTVKETGTVAGVTNDADAAGKTVTIKVEDKNGDGKLTATVTPTDGITFTNTYDAKGEAVLEVTKAVEGAGWPAGKKLTFTLAGEGGTMPENKTAELSAPGKATFGAIKYTAADAGKTYTYTISEDGFGTGWTGSGDVTATVKVTDDGEGKLSTEITYDKNDTITNTYKAEGSVTLEAAKVLTGRDWQKDETFTFQLLDSTGKMLQEKDVSANGTVTFDAIKYTEADSGKTYEYTITEKAPLPVNVEKSEDVKATVVVNDDGQGKLTADVSYSPKDKTITNTYTPTPVKASITVNKTIDEYIAGSDKTFSFTMTPIDGAPMPEGKDKVTAKITTKDGNGSVPLDEITYVKAGEYKYKVVETDDSTKGWKYDKTEHEVTVKVTDDPKTGKLSAEVVYGDDKTAVDVHNTFAEEATKVTLHVDKIIKDESNSAKDGTFTFQLKNEAGEVIQTKEIATKDFKGTVDFDELEFTKSGTYNYSIQETGTDGNGWDYDTKEYPVVITVSDNFETAILESATTIDGETTTKVTITNVYKADPVTLSTIEVTKSIEDTSGSAPETTFEFTLATTDDSPMPEAGGEKTSVTGEGKATFGGITYEKAGTYNYTITETKGGGAGWQNDTTTYPVVVTVTDNGGKLEASVAYGEKSETSLTVTNTYDPEDATIVLEARKVVDDKSNSAPADETFKFVLTGPDGYSETVEAKAGKVYFKKLAFSKVGTYKYTITEESGSTAGFTYDTEGRAVTVTVKDDGEGKLIATADYGDEGEAVITNPYCAEPTSTVIDVNKQISGAIEPDEDATFTFNLSGEGVDMTTSVTGEGTASFDEIKYAKAGTYYYTVTEVDDGNDDYIYDDAVYTVTVEVKDEGGKLVATPTYTANGAEAEDITFVNTYVPEVGLKVTKTVTSKPANGSYYKEGETVKYKIVVTNTGECDLTDVKVDDELTGDHWVVKKLAAGASKDFTTSYKVTKDDVKAGSVLNAVTAEVENPYDPDEPLKDEDDVEVPTGSDQTPPKPNPPKKKVIPQTGDDTPTGAMAALTVFGAAALTAGTVLQRRKRK